MSVKFRSIYACKFDFIANLKTAGTAHTRSVYHDRVHADDCRKSQVFSSSRHTNFIMIIGPMATQTSYFLPSFTSSSIIVVTIPACPYVSVICTRIIISCNCFHLIFKDQHIFRLGTDDNICFNAMLSAAILPVDIPEQLLHHLLQTAFFSSSMSPDLLLQIQKDTPAVL